MSMTYFFEVSISKISSSLLPVCSIIIFTTGYSVNLGAFLVAELYTLASVMPNSFAIFILSGISFRIRWYISFLITIILNFVVYRTIASSELVIKFRFLSFAMVYFVLLFSFQPFYEGV